MRINNNLFLIKRILLATVLAIIVFAVNVQITTAASSPKTITMNKKSIVLYTGQHFKLKVKKVNPSKASKAVKYRSMNKRVAKVTKNGSITAIAKGNTKIKVTSKINKKVGVLVKIKVIKKQKTSTPVPSNKTNISTQHNTSNSSNNQDSTVVVPTYATTSIPATSIPVSPVPITPEPLFSTSDSELVGRSDLVYYGLITFSPYGMPVGNGRFGGPVWEDNARTLSMQLNNTDTFMYNDASANSNDESGGLGLLNIDFGSDVLGDDLYQQLFLYDGRLYLEGTDVTAEIICDHNSDAIYIKVDDQRSNPSDINIDLKMLRSPLVKRGDFTAQSNFNIDNDNGVILLNQCFTEKCSTGISSNDFYCSTSVGMHVQGCDSTVSKVNEQTARLNIPAHTGTFTIIVGGDSSMDISTDVESSAYANCTQESSYDNVYSSSSEWWKNFWSKSYVYLPTHSDYEQRRTYYMYLAGISNGGSYPSKYNGGIWIAQGDRRDWGNWYWNWNQDSLYQPFCAAGHTELLDPLFSLRESCYSKYQTAAKQLWGIESSDALFIGETSGVLGAETLPDDIAKDVREYLAGTGELTSALKAFGDKRNSFLVPWNWKLSDSGVSYVSHTMVATQETAEYYWEKYCYTRDNDWLRDHAYSFIKGAAELYKNYYGFVKDDDGKYHFYRTNLHEHIWGGKDVIDDLSLARGIFAVAVKASKILNVDNDLCAKWQECLDNLAPYPLSSDSDAIGFTVNHRSGNVTWAQGRKPATLIRALEGTESPQFKMLEKFDVLNMETRDQELDNGDFEIALNTYFDTPGYLNQFKNGEEDKNGSSRFLEDAAKLGRGEDLEVMFASQYKAFHDTPNLLHDQGDYYSAEGYGTWSNAIQQALNQSLAPLPGEPEVIRVFPAWPKAWDAKYKLAAKDGFTVASSMVSGDIQYVEIDSTLGETCRIRNPWDCNVVLYRNGVQSELISSSENELINFSTTKGERIVMVREGTTPEQYRN